MIDNEIINSIKTMKAVGNRLELPKAPMLNYMQVKPVLVKAGGKYVKNGFNFTSDAKTIQDRLCGGEKIDDKKKFQFFETPEPLVKQLVELADIKLGDWVLEPSAGHGAICKEIRKKECVLHTVELMPENAQILRDKGYFVYEGDFLKMDEKKLQTFNKIIANPPFTKHQDIDHVRHMYSLLDDKEGGRLVSVVSSSWTASRNVKPTEFREWLLDLDATILDIPKGTFKESGTMVGGHILVIDKVE